MNYIIQIKYGQPFEHPILLDNFITAFPNIDVNNLPSNFAKFERVPKPEEGVYEELIGLSYQWDGDIVKDVWEFRQFTEQEKIDKQNFVKSKFAEYNSDLQSWVFDEVRCGFVSPVPYPNDGELYFWKERIEIRCH